eukprot:jgi/Orpsp1_1/1179445/evm.model.c7180000069391.1
MKDEVGDETLIENENKDKIKIENKIVTITEPLIFAIKLNKFKLVEKLLRNSIDINEQDENNNTPYIIANEIGCEKIKELINNYSQIIESNKKYSMDENIIKDKINDNKKSIDEKIYLNQCNAFNENYSDKFNVEDILNKDSEFGKACIESDEKMIEILLLSNLYDINYRFCKCMFSPLMILIYKEDYKSAKLLINNNANVNIRDIYNNTPLIYMLKYLKQNEEIYKLLIDHGSFIDEELFNNKLFISQIIKNNLFIKLYINKEIKILSKKNKTTEIINKPLLFAINLNHIEFIECLLNNGIDINEKDDNNISIIDMINQYNINKKIKKLIDNYIINHPVDINNKIKTFDNNAVNDNNNDNDTVIDNNKINNNDENELIDIKIKEINNDISNENDIEYKNFLLFNEKYDKNYYNENDNNSDFSELFKTCIQNNKEMIKFYVESKIFNVHETFGYYQFCPLMLFIYNEDYENAKYLINNMLNVNIRDVYNNTPFIYMLKYLKQNEEIYDLLINNGAYIDHDLFNNDIFLEQLYKNSLFNKYYMNDKINLCINNNGLLLKNCNNIIRNLLKSYCLKNKKDVSKFENKKEKLNIDNNNLEYTELYIACQNGDSDEIERIIRNEDCDMNKRCGENEFTPLMLLIYKEDYENAMKLIQFKADVNIKDKYLNTPLIYMLKYLKINKKIYQLLINNGAYIDYELIENFYFIEKIMKNSLFLQYLNDNKIELRRKKKNKKMKKVHKKIENSFNKFNKKTKTEKIAYQKLFNEYNTSKKNNENNENNNNLDNNNINNKAINTNNNNQNNNQIKLNDGTNYYCEYNKKLYKKDDNVYYSSFWLAFVEGNTEMIKSIVFSGIYNLNEKFGIYQFTPLMILIFNEDYENAKILLENNRVDVNERDYYKNTPFIYLIKYHILNREIYDLLIKRNAFIDYDLLKEDSFIKCIINNPLFMELYEKDKIILLNNDNNLLLNNCKRKIKKYIGRMEISNENSEE